MEIAGWDGPPIWLHGDLHPFNLVVNQGRLSAVIDFGDLCAGDPATDLAVAWMLFPLAVRSVFGDAVGVDADTWRRAVLQDD
jgi:aminoglycoside phosphotransferase (APT) family kinase protein